MSQTFNPCPICSGRPLFRGFILDGRHRIFIQCEACGQKQDNNGQGWPLKTAATAVWNAGP